MDDTEISELNGSTLNGTMTNMTNTTTNGGCITNTSIAPSCEIHEEDTLKILIATDNHLGCSDSNPERENDSFVTFEEILVMAKEEEVDFLLLGGDLFHENKPKPATFQRAIDLLHIHVLGDKPVQFEYLGDPAKDFRSTSTAPEINYYNPNVNIGLPIFTIHGNHDDPIGGHRTSVVDHLAASGLVNHFGQWSGLQGFEIKPICLKKGKTQLALYGLGHMKDERLFRLMRDNKVTFLRPEEDSDAWFNLFVLHQNHVKHGPKSYFPEEFLPEFLDYVVWGHEHECIRPEGMHFVDDDKRVYILQPGSSVATSLAEGESKEKHVVLLHINKRNFKSNYCRLETVRPFVWNEMKMSDILGEFKNVNTTTKSKAEILKSSAKYVESYVEAHIRNMIDEASLQLTGHPNQPKLPLIRLRIEVENETEQFNTMRLSQAFAERVANDDIITFKRKNIGGRTDEDVATMSIGAMREMINNLDDQNLTDLGAHVEEIVEQHFAAEKQKPDGQVLEILSDKGLSEAVRCCVDKDDKESVSLIVDAQMKATITHLMSKNNVTLDTIEDAITAFREARFKAGGDIEEARSVLAGRKNNRKNTNGDSDDEDNENDIEDDFDDSDDESDDRSMSTSSSKGRGRGGRGAAAASAPKRKAANTGVSSNGSSARGGRGRGRGGAKGGAEPRIVQTKLPVVIKSPPPPSRSRVLPKSSSLQFDDSD